jgi:hypothetical protein
MGWNDHNVLVASGHVYQVEHSWTDSCYIIRQRDTNQCVAVPEDSEDYWGNLDELDLDTAHDTVDEACADVLAGLPADDDECEWLED